MSLIRSLAYRGEVGESIRPRLLSCNELATARVFPSSSPTYSSVMVQDVFRIPHTLACMRIVPHSGSIASSDGRKWKQRASDLVALARR